MVAGLVVNFHQVNILLVNLIICDRGLLKGRGMPAVIAECSDDLSLICDDHAVVWHIWFRGDTLAASDECAMSVCHWERYVKDACLSAKNVTASVWISDAVVVIVLVFLLTIDCRKKEGDSLG